MILPLTLEKTLSNARQVEVRFNCFLFQFRCKCRHENGDKVALFFCPHKAHCSFATSCNIVQ